MPSEIRSQIDAARVELDKEDVDYPVCPLLYLCPLPHWIRASTKYDVSLCRR